MKWIARSFVFAVALILGASAVSVVSMFNSETPYPDISVYDPSLTNGHTAVTPDGIRVMYAGWQRGKGEGPYLKFIIYNGLNQTVSYYGYVPTESFATIRVNGFDETKDVFCTLGSMPFEIPPGRSAEVQVRAQEFTERPRKGDTISVAYLIWCDQGSGTGIYTTEPFLLPDEFREAIPRPTN